MKKFTKKQKIFLGVFPFVYIILLFPVVLGRMGVGVGDPLCESFSFLILPLYTIFFLPVKITGDLLGPFPGAGMFLPAGGGFLYGLIFVLVYKLIRNR